MRLFRPKAWPWIPRALCRSAATALLFAGIATASAQGLGTALESIPSLEQPQALVIVTVWPSSLQTSPLTSYYEDELRQTIEDLGVRVQFVSLQEATTRSFAGRIVLLRILEDAEESRRNLGAVPASALAWTHAPNGSITPFGVVDLGALRRFLQGRAPGLALDRDELLLGRALARVSAHEIFHMVTRSKQHSARGLMQPSLTVDELITDRCPGWLGENRRQAQIAFPQALTNGVVAAVRSNGAGR
jgi:hypothetical protein